MKPDHEAESIRVSAKEVRKEKDSYFPRSKTHGGNHLTAKGDVKIEIRRPIDNSDSDTRPGSGSVLVGSDPDKEVRITARRVDKKKETKDGREIGTASGGVRIFGKLRRKSR